MPGDPAARFRCASGSHAGLRRQNNEDRVHYDLERGLFIVVDGVGGQAAGEKAADIAMAAVRAGVERGTGSAQDRLETAIIDGNNEIVRQAQLSPELAGMGCVLTAAVVSDGTATIAHVGDTRLYKFRHGSAVKITHDHSPVGEQEERGELSEAEAMRHPMRNQIFRALGAAEQSPSEPGFVESQQVAFEDDSALLLCSDGLTDLVPLGEIAYLVDLHAGDPRTVVERLIDAANSAGGKDNVSVIFVAGERFATAGSADPDTTITRKISPDRRKAAAPPDLTARTPSGGDGWLRRAPLIFALGALAAAGGFLLGRTTPATVAPPRSAPAAPRSITVGPGTTATSATIGEALATAAPGDTILVEPGEYRGPLSVRKDVTLTSVNPRQAVILPAIGQTEPAVVIDGTQGARLIGFAVRSPAGAPIAIGIQVLNGSAEIADLEVSGTREAAIEIATSGAATVRGTSLRITSGTGILVRPGAAPRLTHNLIARDRDGASGTSALDVQGDAKPVLVDNVISGFGAHAIAGPGGADRDRLLQGNLVTNPGSETPPSVAPKTKPPRGP
jgi:PPM family protein phosphatase